MYCMASFQFKSLHYRNSITNPTPINHFKQDPDPLSLLFSQLCLPLRWFLKTLKWDAIAVVAKIQIALIGALLGALWTLTFSESIEL